jgi:putative membrane protein
MKLKTITSACATALCALAMIGSAHAEVSKSDQEFITKAAAGGMYEVEAGKLAQAQGKSDGVKSYGDMLVKDHGAANDELKALASSKGAMLPSSLPDDKRKRLDKLSKAKDFDREFIKQVGLDDHRKDIALFERASTKADDADVKAFAGKTLPTLKAHKDHAESLKKSHK